MPSDDLLLHFSRAAGLGAYIVFWLDMCFGLLLTSWLAVPFLARWRISDLHPFTGLLGLGLLAAHVAVLVGLRSQPFTLPELLVPFARQISPIAPLLGISALYVLILVIAVSHARRRIGVRTWRAVHSLSFAGFTLSLAHAVAAGPDGASMWLRVVYAATSLSLAMLMLRRFRRHRTQAATAAPFARTAH